MPGRKFTAYTSLGEFARDVAQASTTGDASVRLAPHRLDLLTDAERQRYDAWETTWRRPKLPGHLLEKRMSIGQLFVIIAAILFFLVAVNVQAIPNGAMWGWFFFAVGWLTSGIPLWRNP